VLELDFATIAGMPTSISSARLLSLNAEWLPVIKTLFQVRLTVLRLALATRWTSSLFNRHASNASWDAPVTLWLQAVANLVCPKEHASSWLISVDAIHKHKMQILFAVTSLTKDSLLIWATVAALVLLLGAGCQVATRQQASLV
jgi:hypothetical protein